MSADYEYYRDAFAGRLMPFAFVDLDRFDQNVQHVLERARGRKIAIASKSVRCVEMLRRIQAASPDFHAIMAYCAREAVFLADHGFDNILVAYPVLGELRHCRYIESLQAGKTLCLMIDSVEHVEYLEALGAETGTTLPVCIDVDMSSSYPGLHFGVRRSSVTTGDQAVRVWRAIQESPHVRLDGVMGYEAQVAGLSDRQPGRGAMGPVIRTLKRRSIREVAARRKEVVDALRAEGAELRFVNGGGTGSVEFTILEDCVTEVTVGSGFYCSGLFDYYDNFKHQPSAGFAIEIVRQPTDTIYTCHGGGYIASGAAGPDKLPVPWLPLGAQLLGQEGAGEVQTPIVYKGPTALSLGAPVFMRHAKAGELCERFNTLLLLSKGQVVGEAPTYRGEGQCFL